MSRGHDLELGVGAKVFLHGGFQELGVPVGRSPLLRIIIFWGLYCGSFLEINLGENWMLVRSPCSTV